MAKRGTPRNITTISLMHASLWCTWKHECCMVMVKETQYYYTVEQDRFTAVNILLFSLSPFHNEKLFHIGIYKKIK